MEFDIDTYGEKIASVYDQRFASHDELAVEALARLARGGRVLELGIGTGRVALPLSKKGINVTGIDASPAMVEKLRAKPGGDKIPVTIGDFAEVAVDGMFDLTYVVFNTFFALYTQEAQVRCFENVARRLNANGRFVIEAFVPDLWRFQRKQVTQTIEVEADLVQLEATIMNPVTQVIDAQQVMISEQGIKLYPVKLRYVWPAEMDLMAKLAGLKLVDRWSSWKEEPFESSSGSHISIYGKP